jgi:hypothetical protein
MYARAISILVAVLVVSCDPGFTKGSATTTPISVSTAPPSANVPPGGSQPFVAQVSGTTFSSVTWSIQEGAPGGGVTSAGVYTAPGTAGVFHVVATSAADPTKSGSSTVTVNIGVTVSPSGAPLDVCGTQTFTATVVGTTNTAVNWSVQEGASGGTIDSTGLYTAPSTPGTYHVVATSQADSTATGTATVTVSQHILSVQVLPATISLAPGGTTTFTAKVTNTCGTVTATRVLRPDELERMRITAAGR